MNPLTRERAGSGSAPPAYLEMTSTTSLTVLVMSLRRAVSLRAWSGGMGGRLEEVEVADDEGEELEGGMGWREAVKSRMMRIWASMCAVAYYTRQESSI